MSNLSEQSIINKIEYIIRWKDFGHEYTREDIEVIEKLYNLYQKQQKEIEELKVGNIKLKMSQYPDTTDTYKKLKRELEKMTNEDIN